MLTFNKSHRGHEHNLKDKKSITNTNNARTQHNIVSLDPTKLLATVILHRKQSLITYKLNNL